MTAPVVIVGAGPAGLAAAIHLARRNLAVTVLERAAAPPDKACGEGLMPSGVAQLTALGVRKRLQPHDSHPLQGVRYVQEDGSSATGHLPSPGGLGIRRTTLTQALADAAVAAGAEIVWNCGLASHRSGPGSVALTTTCGPLEAALLVAADGLHSPVRRRAGLERPSGRRRRFGLRRHYRGVPAGDFVEVHLAAGREAFLTPVAPDLLGVAFLWDPEIWSPPATPASAFAGLLEGFPVVKARCDAGEPVNRPQGAGPLAQGTSATVADRLVLLGDAAGYRDAITGEGLSLAFASAAALADILPRALAEGATAAALAPYARAHRRLFRHYALVTDTVLAIARRPRLRRPLVRWLGARSGHLDRLVAWGLR